MTENDKLLVITHTLKLNNEGSPHTITFYHDSLSVKGHDNKIRISYFNLEKLKFSKEYVKLILKGENVLKIPTTPTEQKKLREIFVSKISFEESTNKKLKGVALVKLADLRTFILIYSYDIYKLKKEIITKISEKFFPAFTINTSDNNQLDKLILYAKCNNEMIKLNSNDDLKACLKFCKRNILLEIKEI
ncbi:hypothetical protein A0H76_468 [Hepatospora eriocheir]|uniref:Uncharacterized protein n=1 Tax=Hepatospora eriocheir TaxID=1081669 RepID=A0A1X0QIR6_9MICR|nr:hypothetical protein A0H76_468 [Hepatospora eriocheir]